MLPITSDSPFLENTAGSWLCICCRMQSLWWAHVGEKELMSGRRPVWPAAPRWQDPEIRKQNLINYSHHEDNKPDVVIAHDAQKDRQEQMRSQLGDCVAVSWLSVCLALTGLIPFCSTSSSLLHICQGFSLRADGVCHQSAAQPAIFTHADGNRKIKTKTRINQCFCGRRL